MATADVISLHAVAPGLRANNTKAELAKVKVGWWYHAIGGYQFRCPELRYAPRLADVADYADNGDLFLACSWLFADEIRCEVKWRPDLSFTDAESYDYDTVFFSNGEAMQRAGDSVAAYHVVNAGMTHAAIIGRHTRAAWAKTTRYMKNSQQEEEAWEIDKRLVPFVSIGVTT